jgi:hypothetical protein
MNSSLAVCCVDLQTQLAEKKESGEFTCSKCDVIYSPGFGYGHWGKREGSITFDNVEPAVWCQTVGHQEKAMMVLSKDGKTFWGCVHGDCKESIEFRTPRKQTA